jgi:hypothetical protein
MIFGGRPAAGMTVGVTMTRVIAINYMQTRRGTIELCPLAAKRTPLAQVALMSGV